MKDTRTGAARKKEVPGAVDRAGKGGMKKPDRPSAKPTTPVKPGPGRPGGPGKPAPERPSGKPAPVKPGPGRPGGPNKPASDRPPGKPEKKVLQGPAARAAEARKELRKEGKGNAPRGQAAPRKSAPSATRSNSPAPRAVGPTGPTPTPMPAPQPPSDATGPARTYTPAQMNAMNNDVRGYPGRLPVGSMPSIGVPRGPVQTGPITGARPVPLPQGIRPQRPAGRSSNIGSGPRKSPPPNVPGYNPFR